MKEIPILKVRDHVLHRCGNITFSNEFNQFPKCLENLEISNNTNFIVPSIV